MLIDWFTVGAQVLNFLILVWLMKRFIYQPILNTIDGREKKIADELADAAARKAEAIQERDDFKEKNEVFDQERADLLNKTTDDAETEGNRLLAEAKKARMNSARNGRKRCAPRPPICSKRSPGAPSRKCFPLREKRSPISPQPSWRNA